ncbi:cobalt-precorrin 5A hydrolase [Desulfuromusa kysingii]|uniref:Cobalt-precorrin 5A hydrolase n=1 Tax=Desulfuromusa kysingii TaxID=37625 RepID=A0A1H4AHW5_9BACT|nr:cobalamin biosynthesis protein [Desulfuromusa kysingii]SEA35467.1 cobalt-precorrin 5A hydrolase [Desulfuromusa kysingii]
MKLAAITFSPQGLLVCQQLQNKIPELQLYLHDALDFCEGAQSFTRVMELTPTIFSKYHGLIYVAPCGVVVRSLAGSIVSKLTDPAVVVVDVGARHVVSLLSGHEGGANDLAIRVANIIDAEPVISTTTEAVKDLIIGVGCRRGKAAVDIVAAIQKVMEQQALSLARVRYLATADVKADELGLLQAARILNIPLRIIAGETIRQCPQKFTSSEFVAGKVNLPAVAEPAALLAGRRTSLIVQKQALNGITVAVAQENCLSLA